MSTVEAMVQTKTGREALRRACLTIRDEPGDKDATSFSDDVVPADEQVRALDVLRKPDEYADVIWRLLCATQASPHGAFTQVQPNGAVLIGLRGGRRYEVPTTAHPTLLLLLLDLFEQRKEGKRQIVLRGMRLGDAAVDHAVWVAAIAADKQWPPGALAVLAIRVACATTREELLEACRFDAQEYWR
jgi:hypothetical protein